MAVILYSPSYPSDFEAYFLQTAASYTPKGPRKESCSASTPVHNFLHR